MSIQRSNITKLFVTIISWAFVIVFLLTGFVYISSQPIPWIIMFLLAILMIPQSGNYINTKFNKILSNRLKVVLLISGLFLFLFSTKEMNTMEEVPSQEISKKDLSVTNSTDNQSSMSGSYWPYNYIAGSNNENNVSVVTFTPHLEKDDSVLIWAIRKVSQDFFNKDVIAENKPALEQLDGWENAIVFTTDTGKYYYRIVKDESNGKVIGFSFWKK